MYIIYNFIYTSAIKQLLETVFPAKKICTGFTTDINGTEHLRYELHKNEVLLIASLLLVMKSEITYRNITKTHLSMKTQLSY